MTCDEHEYTSPGTSFTLFASDEHHFDSTTYETYEKFIFPYHIKHDDHKSGLIYHYNIQKVVSIWGTFRIHVHDGA